MGDFTSLKNYFPFHALGFHCNPFRALTDEEWADIAILPPALLATVEATSSHIQLLGEKGRGKSTTLLGLQKWFNAQGQIALYEYLPEGQTRFKTKLGDVNIFLLDESQRLTHRERNRLLSSATRLVFSSHQDLTPHFQRHNLPLTSFHLDTLSTAQLGQILNKRLAYFSLKETMPPTFSPTAVQYLHNQFGSNLRANGHFLYEVFQSWAKKGDMPRSILETHLADFSE